MINYSFLFYSRLLLILYIYIHYVNGRPLENQLTEWATVLKQMKLLLLLCSFYHKKSSWKVHQESKLEQLASGLENLSQCSCSSQQRRFLYLFSPDLDSYFST